MFGASKQRLSQRSLIIIILLLAALVATQSVVLAVTTVKSGGAAQGVKVATENLAWNLTAEDVWTDVPGMSATLTVPSGQKGLFLITFSATSHCEGQTTICQIRARVDNQPTPPAVTAFDSAGEGFGYESYSAQFVAGPLNAGAHTVKIQALVDWDNSEFELGLRTLSVIRFKTS